MKKRTLLMLAILLPTALLVGGWWYLYGGTRKELPGVGTPQLTVPRVYSGFLMLPEEGEWAGGLCFLGSLGMLVEYDDSALDFSDVVACSGIGTYAEIGGPPGKAPALGVGRVEFSIGNAASNLGYDLVLGIGTGGVAGDFQPAQTVTFSSRDEAFSYLKEMINSGVPVEVHLNPYYTTEDFATVSEKWEEFTDEKWQASHFMVVTGYDDNYVYLNDPTEPDADAAVGMPTTVDNFLKAWEEGANEAIQGARLGPYWMIYLSRNDGRKTADEIKAWNRDISADTVSQIRAYADSAPFEEGCKWHELAKPRQEFAAFLRRTGDEEAAVLYEEAAEHYRMLPDIIEDGGDVGAHLNKTADFEEAARELY